MDTRRSSWGVVPLQLFDELTQSLRRDLKYKATPALLPNTIRRIQSGVLEGQILTDGWPDFSMIVSKVSSLRRQLNEIFDCCVFSQDNLTPSLADQLKDMMKTKVGEYKISVSGWMAEDLLVQLQVVGTGGEHSTFSNVSTLYNTISYYLPEPLVHTVTKNGLLKCPEGYVLQKLEEKHTEFVASKWNYSPRGGKVSFFTNLIKLYHNVGLFPKLQSGEVCESPIGWCLQHYNGNLGHLFVCDEYRRKGLAKVLVQYMCTQILNDGQIPGCMVEKENISAMSFFESLGFVESDSRYGFICLYC